MTSSHDRNGPAGGGDQSWDSESSQHPRQTCRDGSSDSGISRHRNAGDAPIYVLTAPRADGLCGFLGFITSLSQTAASCRFGDLRGLRSSLRIGSLGTQGRSSHETPLLALQPVSLADQTCSPPSARCSPDTALAAPPQRAGFARCRRGDGLLVLPRSADDQIGRSHV